MQTEDKKEISKIAAFVGSRLDEIRDRRNQREIAEISGYANQNMITMIKQGQTKVAIDRVHSLAKALEVDQKYLMRLALEQFYSPAAIRELEAALCDMTAKEQRLLTAFREASANGKDMPDTELMERINTLFV